MNELVGGDRVVLPQWLSFSKASHLREHSVFATSDEALKPLRIPSSELLEALDQFRRAPEPFIASQLMGVAIVMGEADIASEVAQYVVTQPIVGPVALAQADQILRPTTATAPSSEREALRALKLRLASNPHDAIGWVERARFYTVLGHSAKAKASILAALHLAPENRYVVRSAVRFYVHQGDWDTALNVAQRAYSLTPDPLIFGPLLSVATHVEKLPNKIKPQIVQALASRNRFLFSEVLGAAGTIELVDGADQKARRFFKEAWIDPTRSVIGHSQWVLRERLPGLVSEQHIDFSQSYEALGWLRQVTLDFRGSLNACTAWALEEPYARGAYILGSSSACLAGDFIAAEKMAQAGVNANPKDLILINNLGFAQLHNGRLSEAEKTLKPLERHLTDETQIAPAATFGMLRMAQRKPEEGEILYAKAIDRAMNAKNRPIALRATLNYLYSSMTLLNSLNVPVLEGSARLLKQHSDAGCIGVADAICRKLKRSDLHGSDEISKAAKAFIQSVGAIKAEYVQIIRERFHDRVFLAISTDIDVSETPLLDAPHTQEELRSTVKGRIQPPSLT